MGLERRGREKGTAEQSPFPKIQNPISSPSPTHFYLQVPMAAITRRKTEVEEGEQEQEAARLKALAESKYKTTNNPKSALKYAKRAQRLSPELEGISETVTSLNILCAPDMYDVLGVDPFANANTIRKQYNNLALLLHHPDKNPCHVASEEAFKLVGEAFRILSDRTLRKDYDAKLREETQTFWTACSTCRVLHQFERRYVGHNLMCPGCNKGFKAVEVIQNDGSFEEETLGDFVLKKKNKNNEKKNEKKVGSEKNGSLKGSDEVGVVGGRLRKKMRTVGEVLESSKPKRVGTGEEMMTLAEFQSKVKRKAQQEKMKEKEEEGKIEKRSKQGRLENKRGFAVKEKHEGFVKRKGLRLGKHRDSNGGELEEVMAVVDSDFYDFDKDRVERSFKKGQVWAVYDDDDGMPRHYALIDETVSANPFEVRISWLDIQNNGDGKIVSREKLGFHIPCGRFKVSREASISSVNIFSHIVDCDRAAREVYKVYPKKGSVWALYNEATLDADEGKRCYDIVVFLTSYSEVNGLSMAYLEKVDGYKTVFKRQEMGSHAIRFLGKDDIWLISHQIPARKFPFNEAPELLKDCWELDPASLPSDLLTVGGIDN